MTSKFSIKRTYATFIFYLIFLPMFSYGILIQKNMEISILIFYFFSILYLTFFTYNTLYPRVFINKSYIYIRSGYFYQTNIKNIFIDYVKIIDLGVSKELQPQYKLFDWRAWLPGYHYHSGWITLKNQRPAFFEVLDFKSVVYLPTEKGPDVLLSLEEPEEFIAALKEAHANC